VPTADDFDIFHLAELFDLTPDGAEVYFYRGYAYEARGNYEAAIADYTTAIGLKPDDAYAYHNRGNAYYKTGDYGRAYADWDQVLRLNPDGD
jgi:tetratricopeptide (TPR) repeat protein